MSGKKLWEDFVALEKERDALRAEIESMKRQEPAAWLDDGTCRSGSEATAHRIVTNETKRDMPASVANSFSVPLYAEAGAQPSPAGKDESVRKAWARYSNELNRSPDAPYPGMADAFELHFSQSFTDREWRAESATWAAAWKAAKNHSTDSD
jgi:hypothetical protein